MRTIVLGFAVVFCHSLASAQETQSQQAPPQQSPAAAPTTTKQSQSTRETLKQIAARHEELAKLLDPGQYPPAFVVGAQAAYLAPAAGATAFVVGYDMIWMQINLDVGIGFGGDPAQNTDADNVYSFDLRAAFPIHRGVRADFSIVGGGGAIRVDPAKGADFTLGQALAGAQLRVFQTPNVALTGTLGFATLVRGGHSLYVIGAKPLGSASIVYFFR